MSRKVNEGSSFGDRAADVADKAKPYVQGAASVVWSVTKFAGRVLLGAIDGAFTAAGVLTASHIERDDAVAQVDEVARRAIPSPPVYDQSTAQYLAAIEDLRSAVESGDQGEIARCSSFLHTLTPARPITPSTEDGDREEEVVRLRRMLGASEESSFQSVDVQDFSAANIEDLKGEVALAFQTIGKEIEPAQKAAKALEKELISKGVVPNDVTLSSLSRLLTPLDEKMRMIQSNIDHISKGGELGDQLQELETDLASVSNKLSNELLRLPTQVPKLQEDQKALSGAIKELRNRIREEQGTLHNQIEGLKQEKSELDTKRVPLVELKLAYELPSKLVERRDQALKEALINTGIINKEGVIIGESAGQKIAQTQFWQAVKARITRESANVCSSVPSDLEWKEYIAVIKGDGDIERGVDIAMLRGLPSPLDAKEQEQEMAMQYREEAFKLGVAYYFDKTHESQFAFSIPGLSAKFIKRAPPPPPPPGGFKGKKPATKPPKADDARAVMLDAIRKKKKN